MNSPILATLQNRPLRCCPCKLKNTTLTGSDSIVIESIVQVY